MYNLVPEYDDDFKIWKEKKALQIIFNFFGGEGGRITEKEISGHLQKQYPETQN